MARRSSSSLTVNCGSDDFAAAIAGWMEEQAYEVDEDIVEAVGKAGKKAAEELKAKSKHRTGKYAKGWVAEIDASETGVEVVVHNKKYPQLTHLLEKGHAIANQFGHYAGRVGGDNAIAEVADSVGSDFEGSFQQ